MQVLAHEGRVARGRRMSRSSTCERVAEFERAVIVEGWRHREEFKRGPPARSDERAPLRYNLGKRGLSGRTDVVVDKRYHLSIAIRLARAGCILLARL